MSGRGRAANERNAWMVFSEMPKIANWKKKADSTRLVYSNNETAARATACRTPSFRGKWGAFITYRGYTLWNQTFDTKAEAVEALRDEIRDRPAPLLECHSCDELVHQVILNERGDDAEKYHYDCQECGYEGTPKWVAARAV